MKQIALASTLLLVLVAGSAAAPATAQPATADGTSLVGVFLVTATFTDPPGIPPFQVLITFMPGRNANEGTLYDSSQLQLTPNPVCTPDQGVWKRTKGGFIATHLNFCFDATAGYVPDGPTKVRDRLTLSDGGETLDGSQYIEGFDNDGNIVFTGKVTLHGSRVHAEAPPAP